MVERRGTIFGRSNESLDASSDMDRDVEALGEGRGRLNMSTAVAAVFRFFAGGGTSSSSPETCSAETAQQVWEAWPLWFQ